MKTIDGVDQAICPYDGLRLTTALFETPLVWRCRGCDRQWLTVFPRLLEIVPMRKHS